MRRGSRRAGLGAQHGARVVVPVGPAGWLPAASVGSHACKSRSVRVCVCLCVRVCAYRQIPGTLDTGSPSSQITAPNSSQRSNGKEGAQARSL